MPEQPLREPESIRERGGRKLSPAEPSGMLTALASLFGEDWNTPTPTIEELRTIPDRRPWA
jgi:hypothetical protein